MSKLELLQKQSNLWKIQTAVLKAAQEYFYQKGFEQLMPVMLSPITDPLGPDPGSSVIKTGTIEYLGQTLQLTQSMILHKQLALGAGLTKLFIVSPNIRLEHPERGSTGRHLFEFSQIDFEVKYAKSEDIFEFLESLFRHIKAIVEKDCFAELEALGRRLPAWEKFPVYTTHQLEERYGPDWELLSSRDHNTPYFVTCHKREFYDARDWDREGEHFLNYDLYYPEGFGEALSGAEREHTYELLVRRIALDGLSDDSYRPYLEQAKMGTIPPSAGGGFGVERMVRYFTGADHVGDVQLFRRVPGEKVEA